VDDLRGRDQDAVRRTLTIKALAEKELEAYKNQLGPLFGGRLVEEEIAAKAEEAHTIWRRALEEILSDVAGAMLFGPAAVFSTYDMSLMFGFDDAPDAQTEYYPPWRTRLRAVLEACDEEGGYFPIEPGTFVSGDPVRRAKRLNANLAVIRTATADDSDKRVLRLNPLVELCYRDLGRWIAEGKKHLTEVCSLGPLSVHASDLNSRLPALIQRLDERLPPNEYDSPEPGLPKPATRRKS
jgi:hypothetical protein